jgi:hypothetical protein
MGLGKPRSSRLDRDHRQVTGPVLALLRMKLLGEQASSKRPPPESAPESHSRMEAP